MNLIRKLFWVALTIVFGFGFMVLFEDGTVNYVENAQAEFLELKTYFMPPAKKPDANKPK